MRFTLLTPARTSDLLFKKLLMSYLIAIFLMMVLPSGGSSTALNSITVISLRLDYLLHALLFLPVVILCRLSFPKYPLWLILSLSIFLATGLEGVQSLLPYRAYNINLKFPGKISCGHPH